MTDKIKYLKRKQYINNFNTSNFIIMMYIWPNEPENHRKMRVALIKLSDAVPSNKHLQSLIHLALTSGVCLPAVVDLAPKVDPVIGEEIRTCYDEMEYGKPDPGLFEEFPQLKDKPIVKNLAEAIIEFTDKEEAENRALRIRLGFEHVLSEREHELPSVVTWKL